MGLWDSNFKQLVNANPQAFADWLLPGARVIREISEHLNRTLDVDSLYETTLDGEQVGMHIEFQRYRDKGMARRVAEYNILISCKFDMPVVSFVIYLKKDGSVIESPLLRRLHSGRQLSRIDFVVVKLWEVPSQELRDMGLLGLLPLLPLTKEGATQQVVEEVITGLSAAKGEGSQPQLFPIAFTLSSLAFDRPEDKEWLIRRFRMLEDMLQETVIYQYILQQGVAKGEQQGLEQGLEKGLQQGLQQELQDLRELLLSSIRSKFPDLIPLVTKPISRVASAEVLMDLTLKVIASQTPEEFYKILVLL
jgi:predicted transposase/invertase (TIGR01784 family)